MCDCKTPAVGKIYYAVVQMGIQLNEALSSEALEACVSLNTKSSMKLLLQNRWADMYTPLYVSILSFTTLVFMSMHEVKLTGIWWTWRLR